MIWMIEKDFGKDIRPDYPLLKMLSLVDEDKIKKYNKMMESESKNIKTIGRG